MRLPSLAQRHARLEQLLRADSAQTGENGSTDRLMMMLTRSCELRCSYCFEALTEEGFGEPATPSDPSSRGPPRGDLDRETARLAVDLLMTSPKPRLSLQLFGGEPTRRWDRVRELIEYVSNHPARAGRELQIQLTTNGLGLDTERIVELADAGVTVQLSLDGLDNQNRFRRSFLLSDAEAALQSRQALLRLGAAKLRWFMNVTVPPAAAHELPGRYAQAIRLGVPALQLNYATGLRWNDAQAAAWLGGLAEVLTHHRSSPRLQLFNAQAAADPAPLCGDVLCDVDGTLLQVGGVFLERRFPALRSAYVHGHVRTAKVWTGHRATLAELWSRTRSALSEEDADLFMNGMLMGAAADLVSRVAQR